MRNDLVEAKVAELIRYMATTVRTFVLVRPDKSPEEVAEDLKRKWLEIREA